MGRGWARMKRMPADHFRNQSASIRLIRLIRGLFLHSSLEIGLIHGNQQKDRAFCQAPIA
jgi:hypothetical protein